MSGQTKSFLCLTEFQLLPAHLQGCYLSLCTFLSRSSLENTPGHLVPVSDHPGHIASLLSSLLKHFHFLWAPSFSKSSAFFMTLHPSCLPVSPALYPTTSTLRPTLASPPQALICWTTGFLIFLLAQKWSVQTDILLTCTQVKQIVMNFLGVWMRTLGMATQSQSPAHTRWSSGWKPTILAGSTSSDKHRAYIQ